VSEETPPPSAPHLRSAFVRKAFCRYPQ